MTILGRGFAVGADHGAMQALRIGGFLALASLLAVLATAFADARADSLDGVAEPDVLVVGDSLAVGTQPFLSELLAGRNLVADVRNGITTPQGLRMLRMSLRHMTPRTVVVSLGSNDGGDPRRFADRLHRFLALLPSDTCVVWSTIIRPPRKGPYRALNRVLHKAKKQEPRLVVVDWEHAVTGGAVHLRDGLHADEDGYRYRGSMIAQAVNGGCPARAASY